MQADEPSIYELLQALLPPPPPPVERKGLFNRISRQAPGEALYAAFPK